jgi:hypothetical protein
MEGGVVRPRVGEHAPADLLGAQARVGVREQGVAARHVDGRPGGHDGVHPLLTRVEAREREQQTIHPPVEADVLGGKAPPLHGFAAEGVVGHTGLHPATQDPGEQVGGGADCGGDHHAAGT